MKNKFKAGVCILLGLSLVVLAGMCLWTRTKEINFSKDKLMLAAVALTMPDSAFTDNSESTEDDTNTTDETTETTQQTATSSATFDETIYTEDPSLYDEEKHYPVVETLYSEGELGYNDFFVKNSTSFNLNIKDYLNRSLGFDFEDNNEVQVLIYHTHTSESYLTYDAGYFHESFYPRSEDSERNMVRVGEAICTSLKKAGIGVVHATESHDSPVYSGAYTRSRATIEKYMEQYPGIKVTIDIHRDSISYGANGGRIKPTFTVNGRKAAQIMIMSGYDGSGYYDFPFWEENLTFALKLQNTAEQMYPGMTRPLYFGNFAYNMNVNNGSLLIEVGTDVNTLSEAVYTGELLGNVLAKVLQSE